MKVVVVGGGLLGLASAALVTREHPDASVVVIEKEATVAAHQSGRNSGVVHAGLYYEPGSLKARLCRRGVGLLRAYCAERDIAYEACGKVVVATDERELERLGVIEQRARANGVPGVRRLDARGLRAIEPHARGLAALHSPESAIVDFPAVARSLLADVEAAGGELRRGTVARVDDDDGTRAVVLLTDGTTLEADRVLVCAGLHADRLARASGRPASPRIVPFRGEYWALRPERRELVRGLIYPVPDPSLPFLGVHLTRHIDGSVLVGPNAVLATAREGYRRRDVRLGDLRDTLAWPGTWRLAARYPGVALAEVARSVSRQRFVREAQRFVPELTADDVVPAAAGVRAQALDERGRLVDDFRLDAGGRVVWVRNAPSPAATSSLAIAEELVERLALGTSASTPDSRNR